METCINEDDWKLGVCRRDHQPVSGNAATVIMVGWAMSAANNILAADTDIHTSAAASSSKQHPSFEVLFPSLPHSKFCSPYSYPQSQFAREFKYE